MTSPTTGEQMVPPHDQLPTDECLDVAATILEAMAYPLRIRIVLHLLQREATGTELSRLLDANRALLAHHLRHLRVAGVLQRRRVGNHVLYRTAPSMVGLVHATIACADAHVRVDRGMLG